MLWVLVDVAIGLLAVLGLAVAILRVWRRAKVLTRAVGEAGDAVAVVNERLAAAQAAMPTRR